MLRYFFLLLHLPYAINYCIAANVIVPDDILRQVDRYRMPAHSFEATVRITPSKDGQQQEPGTYIIRAAGTDQVLVEATSFDQVGQKFLTTAQGLFFYAPRTKRAIRLTPLQSLRGQASIGDISRISFESDYSVSSSALSSHFCPEKQCLDLQLNSKNSDASYAKVTLVVSKHESKYQALTAFLYVGSGKLLKIAHFEDAVKGLPPATRYIDALNPSMETRVEFEKIIAADFPSNLFNPRTLEQ